MSRHALVLLVAVLALVGCAPERDMRDAPREWDCVASLADGRARPFRGRGSAALFPAAAAGALGDVRAADVVAVECTWPIDGPWLRSLREPAATPGFLGRSPNGDLAASLDGTRVRASDLPMGAALPALLPVPRGDAPTHELRIRFDATPHFRVVGAEPVMWRVGELGALQVAQRRYYLPDLASAVVLCVLALGCTILAALLWRARSRNAEVFLWLAVYTLLLALARIHDNPLLASGRRGDGFTWLRVIGGVVLVAASVEVMRILTGLPRSRWFVPIYLATAVAAALRAAILLDVASYTAVGPLTNYVNFVGWFYAIALAVIAARRRPPGYLVLLPTFVLPPVVGLGRIGFLMLSRALPDLQPVANNLVVLSILGVALTLVARERRQLVRAEALARYAPAPILAWLREGRAPREERRTITMFQSDLKGFTALSDRLEPEELAALLDEYLTNMAEIAERWGGTVDKFIGDAVLVMFGAPDPMTARDGAIAAVRMAAEMQRALGALNAAWRAQGMELGARMGIHTGEVVVGELGSAQRSDYTAVGAEAAVAGLLESRCPVGKILLSDATGALVAHDLAAMAVLAEDGAEPTWVVDPAEVSRP